MKVTFYHRKPRPEENFSIENYFKEVRKHLSSAIESRIAESRYFSNGFFPRLYNTLEALFRQGDINHVTGDTHYLALLLRKRKTILTIHDCGFMQHPSAVARWVLWLFWLALPVRRSACITTVSAATRAEVIQYTHCSPDKVIVIPTCIKERFIYKPKPFNEERPRILHIGTAPNKNLPRLIQALAGVHCVLDIVGKLSEEQRQLLSQYNIKYENAYALSNEEMRKKYELCDLLAFVSTLEGFGMPIIEANTVGRPVVTSNVSSMPEVAQEAACLVDPYDIGAIREGILKVINNPEFRQHLIQKGQQNYQRFTAPQVALQYEQLYEKIYT